jgi:hypothetical protein
MGPFNVSIPSSGPSGPTSFSSGIVEPPLQRPRVGGYAAVVTEFVSISSSPTPPASIASADGPENPHRQRELIADRRGLSFVFREGERGRSKLLVPAVCAAIRRERSLAEAAFIDCQRPQQQAAVDRQTAVDRQAAVEYPIRAIENLDCTSPSP